MAEKIDICNMSLRLLGAGAISSTELTADTLEQAKLINDVYDVLLDEVLSIHPWNFAIKRANLTELGGTITTWTASGTTNVWQAALTTEPAIVEFNGTEGTEQTSVAACTAEYYWYWESNVLYVYSTSDPDDAYDSIDAIIAEFEFTHAFQLPTDCLRVIRMKEDDAEFVIEADRLFTDEEEAKILYIAQITTTTNFSPVFISAFSARIAAEIAFPLTNSTKIMEDMYKIYLERLSFAKGVDAQEGSARKLEELGWQEARE